MVFNKIKRTSYTMQHKKIAKEWSPHIIYPCKNLFKLFFKILCLKSLLKTELKLMSGKVFLLKHTVFNTFFFTRLVNSKAFKSIPSCKIRFIKKIQIKMSKNIFSITINTFEKLNKIYMNFTPVKYSKPSIDLCLWLKKT